MFELYMSRTLTVLDCTVAPNPPTVALAARAHLPRKAAPGFHSLGKVAIAPRPAPDDHALVSNFWTLRTTSLVELLIAVSRGEVVFPSLSHSRLSLPPFHSTVHRMQQSEARGSRGLRIAVIGSGVSGLTCAIPLMRAGVDVHVYEAAVSSSIIS